MAISADPPAAAAHDRLDERVRQAIRHRADADGFVAFDRFVEAALYTPGAGYYERPRDPVGAAGDYVTAAHDHPLFARVLGERLRRSWKVFGRPDRFAIAEAGAGDGRLAAGVVEALRRGTEAPREIEYFVVERSCARAKEALRRVAAAGAEAHLAEGVAELVPFTGVVLAHELLDAFPFRRLARRDGSWAEQGVREDSGAWRWAERPGRAPEPGIPLPAEAEEGTVLEISPIAEGWIREVADTLARGELIVVDYGASTDRWLRGAQDGTLSAVRGHHTVDPLDRPGSADLTAWVNFDRVRAAGRRAGLLERGCSRQREALVEWGLPALSEAEQATAASEVDRVRALMAAKSLLLGFENFFVLELATG